VKADDWPAALTPNQCIPFRSKKKAVKKIMMCSTLPTPHPSFQSSKENTCRKQEQKQQNNKRANNHICTFPLPSPKGRIKRKNAMQDVNRRDKVVKGGAAAAQQEQNTSSCSRSKKTKKRGQKHPTTRHSKSNSKPSKPTQKNCNVLTVSELF
jgi:hypothetical protein